MLDFCISKNILSIKVLKSNGPNIEPWGIQRMNCSYEILIEGTILLLQESLTTVTGTIYQRSLAGIILFSVLASFFNSSVDCRSIVPYTGNTIFDSERENFLKNF